MNEKCGAHTTYGATGPETPGVDFEVHPVGTAERLRRLGIIGAQAADLLDEFAEELKASELIDGEWPDDIEAHAARATHDEWLALAAWLRALCTPEVKPPEIPAYPWPAEEDGQ